MRNQSHRGMQPNMRCQQQQLSDCNRSCALGVVAVCVRKYFDLGYVGTSSTNTDLPTIGVLRGQPGHAPPIIELVGQRYPFAPPIIQVRIFENIETTSETKARNLTTTRYIS